MSQHSVVIVLGPYRSGTSVTSRVLAELGVRFGAADALIPADSRNPSGYYERNDITTTNEQFIVSAGGSLENPGAPSTLVESGDLRLLRDYDMSWANDANWAGIKDPRMCATLLAWITCKKIPADRCRIIQVIRSSDAIKRSAMLHSHVASYAGDDPDRIEQMITRYEQYSDWHRSNLTLPFLPIQYEELVENPSETVSRIASFLDNQNPEAIKRATNIIGAKKAKSRFLRKTKREAWWRKLKANFKNLLWPAK